jgi:alkylation response protein AidB-like acyl-CoA dehydrogenase
MIEASAAREDLLAAARALGPMIREQRDVSERERQLPTAVVDAIVEARLPEMYVPRQIGGLEVDPITYSEVVQEVSRHDGATGWCLMVWATLGMLGAYVPEATAREIFRGARPTLVAGTINPSGKALAVPGGYQVTGRWPFGSGIGRSNWVVGNCIVWDGDQRRLGANNAPEQRFVLVPASECEILDTWDVGGLRGTGSNDYTITDVFVPEDRTLIAFNAPPLQPGPLYACPFITTFAAGVAAPALGIARGAIDAFFELANTKTPTGSANLLRERSAAQADLARAEGLLGSARAYLYETISAVWDTLLAGREVTMTQRAMVRIAGSHAAVSAAQAVDLLYNAGGGSSLYTRCPLERAFRDVHAVTQHIGVAPVNFEMAGKVLLGMPPGTTRF